MISRRKLDVYRAKALRYTENAYRLLGEGEAEKAAELLWGAFAEVLKGVAARKGLMLRHHAQVREFALGLAKELGDPTLWDLYRSAEHLHSEFYETPLSVRDVAATAERIKAGVARLIRLMEQPLS